MRSRSDRLVAVATLGAFVVVAGVLGMVSLYLGAVTQAMSGVQRIGSLPDYEGRPQAQQTGVPTAMRYLVLVTDDAGGLASAYLAQLSSNRDALYLVGLPANLLVADDRGLDATLADRFAADPMNAVRAVETLLGVRVDHLVKADLDGLTSIVDVLGGVRVVNRVETAVEGWHFPAGDLRLTGAEAQVYLASSKHAMTRLERTEAVVVEIVRGMIGGDALTNPAKVESIGQLLHSGVTVDAELTAGEIRRMALDLHLSPDSVTARPLPLAGRSELDHAEVIVPDTDQVRALSQAMRSDQLTGWTTPQADPWAPLAALPPR
ncbi:LCP family protein [Micropruina sp.]|uniref:LCP family protein n=1 Tax=Micropruina sp. TaxID=2737536 RepID=UPI0039E2847D